MQCFLVFVDNKHSYKALTRIELDMPALVKEMVDGISGLINGMITSKNSVSKNLFQCIEKVEKMKTSIDKKLVDQVFITHCCTPRL